MSLPFYKRISYFLILIVLPSMAWLSYSVSYDYLFENKLNAIHNQLDLFSSDLETEIEKFSFLPRVLSRNRKLKSLLTQQDTSAELLSSINQDLAYINDVSHTEVIYLMRPDGTTIAASNWNAPDSFIGGNFVFRPYFKAAIAGEDSRYFALGTTSKRRGYYFSSPVFAATAEQPIGVIVVKVNIDKLEGAWRQYATTFLVTDSNGVVFSSNKPNWQFRTLNLLSEQVLNRIQQDQQYPVEVLKQLTLEQDDGHPGLVSVRQNKAREQYVSAQKSIPALDWNIYALQPASSLRRPALGYTALVSLLTLLSVALIHLAALRRYNLREKLELKQRSAQQLKEAHDKLEQRVIERTLALSENNQQLEQEITERRRAESHLRETQKELIHSAKLATLGQLASGISHELNQPLAAISNYAENARQFLDLRNIDQTDHNLEEILKLSERMSNITTHLKTFSHKTDDQLGATDIRQCIDHALALMKPRMRSSGTSLTLDLLDKAEVLANPIRLEQVFVNLFGNALDAMENSEQHKIILKQSVHESSIVTTIIDSGSGIDVQRLPHIFDAFYTTKSVGVGLGLGLSISSEIIQSLGGELRAKNHSTLGAQFELELKLAS